MAGIFINVEVDAEVAGDPELAKKLAEVCPVSVFEQAGDGKLNILDENLDECVLCNLCLEVVPDDRVRIVKLYED